MFGSGSTAMVPGSNERSSRLKTPMPVSTPTAESHRALLLLEATVFGYSPPISPIREQRRAFSTDHTQFMDGSKKRSCFWRVKAPNSAAFSSTGFNDSGLYVLRSKFFCIQIFYVKSESDLRPNKGRVCLFDSVLVCVCFLEKYP